MVAHSQSHTPREGARDREATAVRQSGPWAAAFPGPDEEAGRASLIGCKALKQHDQRNDRSRRRSLSLSLRS